jgi:hypothetical protein
VSLVKRMAVVARENDDTHRATRFYQHLLVSYCRTSRQHEAVYVAEALAALYMDAGNFRVVTICCFVIDVTLMTCVVGVVGVVVVVVVRREDIWRERQMCWPNVAQRTARVSIRKSLSCA